MDYSPEAKYPLPADGTENWGAILNAFLTALDKGIEYTLIAGEAIAQYDCICIKTDGKMWKAKADSTTTMYLTGFATEAVTLGSSGKLRLLGWIENPSWAWTPGDLLYLSDSVAGGITITPPATNVYPVAVAKTVTKIAIYPSMFYATNHARLHYQDGPSDHQPLGGGVLNHLISLKAGMLPEDSGILKSDVSDAVSKKHNQFHEVTDHYEFKYDDAASSGLVFAYRAGRIRNDNVITDVAGGTVLVADGSTNYVEIDNVGVVSTTTGGFTSGRIGLYSVVAETSIISLVVDKRTPFSF